MNHLFSILLVFFFVGFGLDGYSQTEYYYAIDKGVVHKKKFEAIQHDLKFKLKEKKTEEALSFAWGNLAAKLVPLLVDGASKLFYNPDNFNKEYFASQSFFDDTGKFKIFDPTSTMVFEHTGENQAGKRELINRFEFEMGAVENVEGYHYVGLKKYEIDYSWAKLSSQNNRISYVLDVGFYYFDDQDKAQEFHLNPLLLDSRTVSGGAAVIEKPNFQVIPKMKVLQIIQVRVREVNDKKQNWDRYLELYQNNQDNISKFLIKALTD